MEIKKDEDMIKISYVGGELEVSGWAYWKEYGNCRQFHKPYGDVVVSTDNVNLYHYHEDADYECGRVENDEYYVLCYEGGVNEGKKILMEYLVDLQKQKISDKKEELENLEDELTYLDGLLAKVGGSSEMTLAKFCEVRYDSFSATFTVKESNEPRASYKKDTSVEEELMHKEHFVDSAFRIDEDEWGRLVGKCWAEDLEVCKRIILNKTIMLLREEIDKKEELYKEGITRDGEYIANCFELLKEQKGE